MSEAAALPAGDTAKQESEFSEHMKAFREAKKKQWETIVPPEFWEYGREARREFFMAMSSLVNEAADWIEGDQEAPAKPKKKQSPKSASGKGKTKVEIE